MSEFQFDRTWHFAVTPDELWDVVTRTDDFPTWWTWLRAFESPGIHAGAEAQCVIQAPLPYALRLRIEVERARRPSTIETYVRGDLDGPARLDIAPDGDGSSARLSWALEVRDRMLRQLSRVARPVMVWAHDRVVATGVEQFRRHALDGHH